MSIIPNSSHAYISSCCSRSKKQNKDAEYLTHMQAEARRHKREMKDFLARRREWALMQVSITAWVLIDCMSSFISGGTFLGNPDIHKLKPFTNFDRYLRAAACYFTKGL